MPVTIDKGHKGIPQNPHPNQDMKKTPRISETEWEVMKVVWAQAPCTAARIIEQLTRADPAWHPKTVKAFLNRLVKKASSGMFRQFFIERDKGPIHPNGRRCPT